MLFLKSYAIRSEARNFREDNVLPLPEGGDLEALYCQPAIKFVSCTTFQLALSNRLILAFVTSWPFLSFDILSLIFAAIFYYVLEVRKRKALW